MANYSTARWSAFQYKLNELMNSPEFKYKPSPALMKFMKSTDFLIPASEKERVLGVKQTDQDTVYVNILNKQSISTGSARAYNHTGSVNDSTREELSFTTYAGDFTYSLKSADRVIWNQAEIVAKQMLSTIIALHETIETALLANFNTNKSQVVNSLTPRSGTWDATNYIFEIANADQSLWMQRVRGFMREQYYKGIYDAVLDETLWQIGEYNVQQGSGNAANLGWQAAGIDAGSQPTQELTLDSGFIGEGYIFPVGGIGIVPWIPRMNREGFGSSDSVGGFYTSIPDPLGSGLTFAVHEYFGGADNQNAAGETQDINVNVEISVDLAPLVAPMSTSNAAPVYKFGILS